jgi:hypothetical protein
VPLEDGLKESPKHVRQKYIRNALCWLLYNFIAKCMVLTTQKNSNEIFEFHKNREFHQVGSTKYATHSSLASLI